MHTLDQYESVFRASDKARFEYEGIHLEKVLVITDGGTEDSRAMLARLEHFFRDVHKGDRLAFTLWDRSDYSGLRDLLKKVDGFAPDLVVTFRCLTEDEKNPPYSLGVYLDVLTQITDYPVLVMPDPEMADFEQATDHLAEVVVVTDHLQGDSALINWGARFVPKGGKLVLAHVEDDAVYARYMDAIGKVPEVPTDAAREHVMAQLLKEPADFIRDVQALFAAENVPIEVLPEVRQGHLVSDYQDVLDAHEGDLLVLHTKDENQRAMKGQAYAIAVEFRHVALLLL